MGTIARQLLILSFLVAAPGLVQADEIRASRGYLDLSAWDPKTPATLGGEWTYHWQQLYTPATFPPSENYIQLPLIWNGLQFNGQAVNGMGFATFQLSVKLPRTDIPLSLYLPEQNMAYRLWLDNALVAEVGIVGDSIETEHPATFINVVRLPVSLNEFKLTMQVSNHYHFEGGPGQVLQIGESNDIAARQAWTLGAGLLVGGALIVMGLYNLLLFMGRREEPGYLFFGLMCMCIAARLLMVVNIPYYFDPLTDITWETRVEYAATFLMGFFFLSFNATVLPEQHSRLVVRMCGAATLLIVLAILVFPPFVFTELRIMIYGMFGYIIYTAICTLVAVFKRIREAVVIAIASVGVMATTAHDLFYLNDATVYSWMPLGGLIFMLAYGILLGSRMNLALSAVEDMSNQISDLNVSLQQRVADRTADLAEKLNALRVREHELVEARSNADVANQAKTEFLATMSHEIRTPLSGILGSLAILKQSKLTGSDAYLVEAAHASTDALLSVLNDALDLTLVESGRMEIIEAPFDLAAMIGSIVSLANVAALDKDLELSTSLAEDLPALVIGDELHIRQILSNLLANAVKFTAHGYVKVIIEVIDRLGPKMTVRFSVEDSGIGIAPDKKDVIFERFGQAAAGPTSRSGVGLGLAISQELAHHLGGEIRFESELGKGTCFHLELSLKEDLSPQQDLPVPDSKVSNLRVLVAEDDALSASIVSILLEGDGHAVTLAPDGPTALRLATEDSWDLIIMDIRLPVIDGKQITEKLRNEHHLDTPILALTANAAPGEVESYRDAGMNGVLVKPVTIESIRRHVNHLFSRSDNEAIAGRFDPAPLRQLQVYLSASQLKQQVVVASRQITSETSRLVEMAENQDLEGIVEVSHKICGTARNFGLCALGDVLLDLETAAKNGNVASVVEICARCQQTSRQQVSLLSQWEQFV